MLAELFRKQASGFLVWPRPRSRLVSIGRKRGGDEIVFGGRELLLEPILLIQIHERADRLPPIRGKRNQNEGAVDGPDRPTSSSLSGPDQL